jgi:hypothetical protein
MVATDLASAIKASYPCLGFFELALQILDFWNSPLFESVLNSRELNFLPADQLEDIRMIKALLICASASAIR